jgi:hypothetical protein
LSMLYLDINGTSFHNRGMTFHLHLPNLQQPQRENLS